jgi:hypothetical protein
MDFKVGICRILEKIFLYKREEKDLQLLLDSIFGIYEIINGIENQGFSLDFHKYWDFLEEINAINEIEKYQNKIDGELLPEFIRVLCRYLTDE